MEECQKGCCAHRNVDPSQLQLTPEVAKAVEQLDEMLKGLEGQDKQLFCLAAMDKIEKHSTPNEGERCEGMRKLGEIQAHMRKVVPKNGMMTKNDSATPPKTGLGGRNSEYTKYNWIHVDSFLYGDDDLIDEHGFQRSYCSSEKCNHSREIKDLEFVSHSFSVPTMGFIFDGLLEPEEVTDKVILDVGSRTGAVLFYGSLMTKCKKMVGIEKCKAWTDMQLKVIQDLGLDADRIQSVQGDATGGEAAVLEAYAEADVVIMNNVFEWFIKDQAKAFAKVRKSIGPGKILVANPPLEELIDLSKEEFAGWVERLPVEYPRTNPDEPISEEPNEEYAVMSDLAKYRTLA